jgi:hypothetical protein
VVIPEIVEFINMAPCNAPNPGQFCIVEPKIGGEGKRTQPDFGFTATLPHVHVRWFISLVGVEEKAIAVNYLTGHGSLLYPTPPYTSL